MAFARHNIEKRRLIELVRLNPILWDCRLPHYKRSDKKKAIKWNELGRIFSVNGERVQRTFTSLREIFRRELNHEKLLGSRFKSKWEYYDAMAFLKEVIRERKSRERSKHGDMPRQQLQPQQQRNSSGNNNNNGNAPLDEYQYFAPNDPNNPNNRVQAPAQQQQQQKPLLLAQQQLQQMPGLPLPPDVLLSLDMQKQLHSNGKRIATPPPAPGNSPHATLSTTHSGSTSPSIFIKDEPDSQDETISLATTVHRGKRAQHAKNKQEKDNCLDAATNKSKVNHNKPTNAFQPAHNDNSNLVIDEIDLGDADLDDELDDVDMVVDGRLSSASTLMTAARQHQPSAREILYTKFGEFLAARLNTLHETVAHELMNKILLLIAEK